MSGDDDDDDDDDDDEDDDDDDDDDDDYVDSVVPIFFNRCHLGENGRTFLNNEGVQAQDGNRGNHYMTSDLQGHNGYNVCLLCNAHSVEIFIMESCCVTVALLILLTRWPRDVYGHCIASSFREYSGFSLMFCLTFLTVLFEIRVILDMWRFWPLLLIIVGTYLITCLVCAVIVFPGSPLRPSYCSSLQVASELVIAHMSLLLL